MSKVTLRRASRADGAALIALHQENHSHLSPWVQPFTDMQGFDAWFSKRLTGGNVSFLAFTPEGEIAGVVNISEIVAGNFQSAYLGFYGVARFGGRGLMTEAVKQTMRFAFNDFGLHRLEANIQPGNSRSVALVKRLGFQKEGFSPGYLKIGGQWCDHERWAILADGALANTAVQ